MQCSLSKTPFGEHQSVTSKIIPTQLVGSENSGKITIGSSSFTSEPQMKQSLASLFSSQKPQPMTTSHTQEKPQVAVRSIVAQPAVSKENQTIYIGCINYSVTQNDLMTAFRPFGNIVTCRLVPLQTGSGHRGYAFIEYDNPTSAAIAIETMNDAQFHGRALKVKYQSSSTTSGTNPGPTSSTITQPLLQNPVQVLPSPSPSPSDSADALLRAKQLALQFSKQHSAKPAAPTSTTIGNVINPHGDHDVSSDFNDDSEFISSAQRADLIRKLAMRDSYPG
ncbi:putative RNA recognition domain containing protein [Blattamonas nauphoetae]|uniref:RNA recognition domain containing protein n=1 Tax=Blattamonas nauphoetae TaxID=2049346 RepID=A0ABQ9YKQ4_9EUKA|nr:putative RNA recognition domain containing protein [Blattamonas nauphoetae]